ncbi:hypothetical protein GGR55DRAFT_652543 [Xylaria sp. FL0064]|nr:hypothetical protein GGR55DRAFT_652543 [Xylaria sp. FL0064]
MGSAISHSILILREAKEGFEQAAIVLIEESHELGCSDEIQEFIDVQKSNCVGNLVWR